MRLITIYLTGLIVACCVFSTRADVRLAPVFTDNMVLQRAIPAPVWGYANPGEKVCVSFAGQVHETHAAVDGKWQVKLEPLHVSRKSAELTVEGKNRIVLKNVLVGEVWICSGQSNMEMGLGLVTNAHEEIVSANKPMIRLFLIPRATAVTPQNELTGAVWKVCTPASVASNGWFGFSAIGYFFGREINKELDVPVGLIESTWGGTAAHAWTPLPALAAVPDLAYYAEKLTKMIEAASEYAVKQERERTEVPRKTDTNQKPLAPPNFAEGAGCLYNAMIAPLVPFAIRGVIWYQGESNAGYGRSYEYRNLFPTMIKSWRNVWGEGDFPFYFVQLANFMKALDQPAESYWAEVRESQSMSLATTNTGMAVIIDIGEANNIHPRNKQEVGRRLALNALANTYGKKLEYSGPVVKDVTIEHGTVQIAFTHAKGGLKTCDGQPLKGFAICGADQKFVWADAGIVGAKVIVSSTNIPAPVAVRYAWANNPDGNLVNKDGLPASPFRTDTFKRSAER